MVLGKEVAAERDLLGHYIPWLATIGSVSPLLGLTGTVFGIMSAFIGIASKGSGNLAAVAPGVAEALVALRPATRVLYVSGHTDDAIVRTGVLEEGKPFLQKPFTPVQLARKIREILEDRPGTAQIGRA